MEQLSVDEMAKVLGEAWASNDGEAFIRLFSKDAVINHPFFVKDEEPRTIVEILNCNVKGTSEYEGYKIVAGDGTGNDDIIEMSFIDTGTNCGYIPKYQGKMIITAYIKNHEFVRFDVYGYDIVESDNQGKEFNRLEDIKAENAYDLAELAGKAWEDNDMDLFTSLFSEDAQIYHPLFKKPVTPELVSDVLNSPMEGYSKLTNVAVISGTGDGENDIIDMYFEETGTQLGYIPDKMGILHMTAKIKNKRFSEFIVHSYTPAENTYKSSEETDMQVTVNNVSMGKMQIGDVKKEG